jgi:septal ring factor EnvC (AmiA/AmiB activator)
MHRVYCSISLRCPFAASESCTWTGTPDDFEAHSARCRRSGSDCARLRSELATAQDKIQRLHQDLDDAEDELSDTKSRLARALIESLMVPKLFDFACLVFPLSVKVIKNLQ